MATHNPSPTSILAAVDYSESASAVVQQALAIARRAPRSKIHFLHVNRCRARDEAEQEGRRLELVEWLAARLPADPDALPGTSIAAHEASGEPARRIVEAASELGCGVVIVGTHDRKGLDRWLSGSVSAVVSRECQCSVIVIRPGPCDEIGADLEPCPLCVDARVQSQGLVRACHDHAGRQGRRPLFDGAKVTRWMRESLIG